MIQSQLVSVKWGKADNGNWHVMCVQDKGRSHMPCVHLKEPTHETGHAPMNRCDFCSELFDEMVTSYKMKQCMVCRQAVPTVEAGYLGQRLMGNHPNNNEPCQGSQSPGLPIQKLSVEIRTVQPTNPTTESTSRKFLTAESEDENILKWFKLVEKQTGNPFKLDGCFQCAAEEFGEVCEAVTKAELEDAFCDTYVALSSCEFALLRELGQPEVLVTVPEPTGRRFETIGTAVGKLATHVRKPKSPERAWAALEACRAGRSAAKAALEASGSAWGPSIASVLDILDSRLQAGYKMNKDGSAIKAEDRTA